MANNNAIKSAVFLFLKMLNQIENAGITILAPNKAIRIRAPNSLFPNKNVPSPDRYMGNTGGKSPNLSR